MNPKGEDEDIKLLSRKEAAAFLKLKPNALPGCAMPRHICIGIAYKRS